MNAHFMIVIIGLCYIIIFGGLSYIRREGLSGQFAFEVLALTALAEAGALLAGITINPIVFLAFIYLFSMRGRLLVEVANFLSGRGRQKDAISLLQFALRLFPDKATHLVILVNMGIVQLRRQNPSSAESLFETVLEKGADGGLGLKYEAACHYNLGLAYKRQGKEAKAVHEFNEALSTLPSSIYGKAADKALEQRRQGQWNVDNNSTDEDR